MTRLSRKPRLLALTLAILMALSLALPAFAETQAQQASPALYINPGADLPIFDTASAEDGSGAVLPTGMACQVVGEQGGYQQILYLNLAGVPTTGWVTAGVLRQKTEADTPSYGIVSSPDYLTRVPLYQKASVKAKTHGKYYNGVTVQVIDNTHKDYVQVRVGTLEGFMPRALLLLDAPYGSVAPALPHPTVQHPKYNGLTLRAEQSFKSDKIGSVPNSGSVTVLGITEEFAHVMLEDGQVGFMQASALSPQPVYADLDPGVFMPEPEGMETVIDNPDGQGAHLRAKGSTKSESLGLYTNGTRVIVTGGSTYWRKVWVDGKTGFMMAKLLRGFVPEDQQPDGEGNGDGNEY